MNVPPQSSQTALDPAPLPLPTRKPCDNCGKRFDLTKPNRRFCGIACKNQFNRFGNAYGPLKQHLEVLIGKRTKEEVRKAWSVVLKDVADTEDFREAMAAAGFVHKSQLKRRADDQQPATLAAAIAELKRQAAELERWRRVHLRSHRRGGNRPTRLPHVKATPKRHTNTKRKKR